MNRRDFLSLVPAAALAQGTRRPTASSAATQAAAVEPDWPQWHGPDRNNISKETGLAKQWPSGGPKLAWSTRGLGAGYGSLSIKGDRIYVQGTKNGQSVVLALDRANGRHVWNAPIGRALDQDRGGGPRGTPTLDGESLYVLSEDGNLACVRSKDAHITWKRDILADFGGRNPNWLISESPLIDGNKLIVSPGGRGAGIVALDKTSGKEIWRSSQLSDGAGYASCIVADIHNVRTIMNLTSEAGVGVRASDGKLMWSYAKAANGVANCTTPVYHDSKVFYTSAYGTGCGLVALTPANGEVKSEEVYFNKEMQNHHGGVILYNGRLYGSSNAILTSMDWSTGKVIWKDRSVGKGSLTLADGMLYVFGENNTVGLAEVGTDTYVEKGRFQIEDQGRPSWAHPVVCGGKLYIRNQDYLNCYDVRAT
jgi:outer membrane protein assembly factor BamB